MPPPLDLILYFLLPLLPLEFIFTSIRSLGRAARDVVDLYLRGVKRIEVSNLTLCSSSMHLFAASLDKFFNLATIKEFVICNVRVALDGDRDLAWQAGLFHHDARCHAVMFPLDVLTGMGALEYLKVESQSTKQEWMQQARLRRVRAGVPTLSAPLQLGLANLHEVGRHCANLQYLHAWHLERDEFGEITDCWGPDCTLLAARTLRTHCRKLVEVGILTSPGHRVYYEQERMGQRPSYRREEMHESTTRSFLGECAQFPSSVSVLVSLCNMNAPHASLRNSVLAAAWERNAGGSMLGEMQDLLTLATTSEVIGELCVFARCTAQRVHGALSSRGMREAAELSLLRSALPAHISMSCVPGDQLTAIISTRRRGKMQIQRKSDKEKGISSTAMDLPNASITFEESEEPLMEDGDVWRAI